MPFLRLVYRSYGWLNIVAVDAPLIAVLWQRYFLQKYQLSGYWLETSLLFLVVWSIYLADRLADAASLGALELSPRHHFYQRYQQPMLWLLCFVLLLAARLSFYLSWHLWLLGLGLLLACALYLRQARFRQFIPKEVSAALLFAGGVTLLAWLEQPSRALLYDSLALALLAFLNMGLLALVDAYTDAQQGQHSLALRYRHWAQIWLVLTWLMLLLSLELQLCIEQICIGQMWLYNFVLLIFLGLYRLWARGRLVARAIHTAADAALALAAILGLLRNSLF